MAIGVKGQTLKGIVIDGETLKPLYPVTVLNISNSQKTTTDEQGNYSIPAKEDDLIVFSFIGYHTVQRLATLGTLLQVELLPLSVQMQEYVLHPGYTPFQKDSAEMAELYSTELNKKAIKPKVSMDGGLTVSGLIGAPVQRMSKSYKRNKKFKEHFKKDMEQKFIDSRYKPELVTALTGFSGDTLATFMNTYPMEYSFARAATDLEIKMWVRNNYREYLKPGK